MKYIRHPIPKPSYRLTSEFSPSMKKPPPSFLELNEASNPSPISDSPEVSPTAVDQSQEMEAQSQNSPEPGGSHENIETTVDQNTDQPALESPITLKIEDVIELMSRKKRHEVNLDGDATVLGILKHRRQVFVIDNSRSMAEHWEDVAETTRALSYIVKPISPGGAEIHMTAPYPTQSRWATQSLFKKEDPWDIYHPNNKSDGLCLMEWNLARIILRIVRKVASAQATTETRSFLCTPWNRSKVRGLDAYILTNGEWGPTVTPGTEEGSGVENMVECAVRIVKSRGLPREFVSIHFIRFGENSDGIRRLNWLAEGIQDITHGWDIVDTTYHKDNVWKMLIGPRSVHIGHIQD